MLHSFYILGNTSCPNSIVCACLLTLVFRCVLSFLCCPVHCPFHSMSFVLPVWLGGLFPCCFPSDSLAATCEGEASGRSMLRDNSRHTAVACGALHEHAVQSRVPRVSCSLTPTRLIRNSETYTQNFCVMLKEHLIFQKLSQVLSNLRNAQTLEWDHLNNDLMVRISLCSCAGQCYIPICLGCLSVWPGDSVWRAFQHIDTRAAIEIKWPYLFSRGLDDPGKASLRPNTVTSVFLQVHQSPAQRPLISAFPLRCRAGACACTNTLNTSPPLSFAMPSAISSSHSSPVSSQAAGAALQRGEQANPVARAAWWRSHLWAISGVHISR